MKSNHGGKRKGSGRKKIYGEPTETVPFRCPKSKVEDLKSFVKAKLAGWRINN